MASTFTLEIVTPDRKFYEGQVEMVIVRGVEGDLGILKGHTPLVTPLDIGRIKIKTGDDFKEAAIASGYVEIRKEKTTIITDTAEWPEEIDIKRAEESKKRALERMNAKSEVDILRAEIALKKAITRLNVAKKKLG